MSFTVKYGNRIEPSYPVPAGYSDAEYEWEMGDALVAFDSGGTTYVKRASDSNTSGTILIAKNFRRKISESAYPVQFTAIDQTYSSGKCVCIAGEAYVTTNRIESGVSFAIGEDVKVGGTGKWTNTGSGQKVGRVHDIPSPGKITFLYRSPI